jgi:hypothetical protein
MTMQEQILECRRQDAQSLRAMIAKLWRRMTAPHNPALDAMETARLDCERQDAAKIRGWLRRIVDAVVGLFTRRQGAAHA